MNDATEMPLYKSHKEVRALEIETCEPDPTKAKAHILTFTGVLFDPVVVDDSVVKRYYPAKGDYYVVYADGYQSISPRRAFLDGYTPVPRAPRSAALQAGEALSAKGAKYPRVTMDDIEKAIASRYDFTLDKAVNGMGFPSVAPLQILTMCILVMRNGYVVTGESAPASPENFDPEKGKTFAYENAIKKLYPLMGYALRDELHRQRDEKAAG